MSLFLDVKQYWQSFLRHADLSLPSVLLAGTFALYLRTMAPSVATIYDDSLELQLVSFLLGIAHPTGYPLYLLIAKLFTLLPIYDVAYRVNLLSGLFASASVALAYLVSRGLGLGRLASLSAATILASSTIFWSQAVIAEVYALNALFLVLALYLALRWGAHPALSNRTLTLLAFVLGVSLAHHRTMILLGPALALYILWGNPGLARSPRQLLRLGLAFLVPLALYLYLPLRGLVTSSLDETYRNTLAGFLSWIGGADYGVFLAANPMAQETRGVSFLWGLMGKEFTWAGIVTGLVGLAWLVLRWPRRWAFLALATLTYLVFAANYRVADVEIFFIPFLALWTQWIGAGMEAMQQIAGLRLANGTAGRLRLLVAGGLALEKLFSGLVSLAGYAIALGLPIFLLITNLPRVDASRRWAAHDYGIDILRQPMEENAAVVGILGEMSLLRYFQETQGYRPDLLPIPADTEPQRLQAARAQVASGRAVYLTRPSPGMEQEYSLASFGPLIKVQPGPQFQPPNPQFSRLVDFEGRLQLLGYDLDYELVAQHRRPRNSAAGVVAGKKLRVTLYWQAPRKLAQNYQVSLRLVSPQGLLVGQRDGTPVRGGYPVTAWRPGEVVMDTYDLPVLLGTPPGEYNLVVTVYSSSTLQGLKVSGSTNREALVTLGSVKVLQPWPAPALESFPLKVPVHGKELTIPGWMESDSLEALGIQKVVRGNLDNEISLYGYGLAGDSFQPGDDLVVTLLWQAIRRPLQDHVVFLQLLDGAGKLVAGRDSQPLGGSYPTSRWLRDEVVRDQQHLLLPRDIPDGDYRLIVGMYVSADNKERLTAIRWTRRSGDWVDLGMVRVKGRPRTFVVPRIETHLEAQFGNAIKLIGYDIGTKALRPGDVLPLTLYWQSLEGMDVPYTVFVHVLDSHGRLAAQHDGQPGAGLLPTTSWVRGEIIRDQHVIRLPEGLAPGEYFVVVGMYDPISGQRLEVKTASGLAQDNAVSLVEIRMEK
ncbi:MAG: DUF2723 domain-containing protein [Chloroflexi bacterium]|nr:DUF2723 domain-containing protein [Chloroflexota bacterium]